MSAIEKNHENESPSHKSFTLQDTINTGFVPLMIITHSERLLRRAHQLRHNLTGIFFTRSMIQPKTLRLVNPSKQANHTAEITLMSPICHQLQTKWQLHCNPHEAYALHCHWQKDLSPHDPMIRSVETLADDGRDHEVGIEVRSINLQLVRKQDPIQSNDVLYGHPC